MNAFMRRHVTYANTVATMALVFAMSGSALAASHYLISSTKQISPKVRRALKGNTGPQGLTGATGTTGATGPEGKQGQTGKEGPEGKRGESATRLWASVNGEATTPTIIAGSGVTSVSRLSTGLTLVTFDQNVSKCSFQATLVSPGGGYFTPPNEISTFTGFYEYSGLTEQQVVVATVHSSTPTNGYSFSIAALC